MSRTVGTTTIGPGDYTFRDAVPDYRDKNDHPNYNAVPQAMFSEVNAEQ